MEVLNMTDRRSAYIEGILKAFKAGEIDMADAIKAIRRRKPNQAKLDGAQEFAKLIMDGKVEEAFAKYRFGLKNVRQRRRSSKNGKSA
jgi:LDH2 family malate/lactate/ureidoglycolate dehydrogenase